MDIVHREVDDDFNIFLIGDAHIGSAMFHGDGLDEMVDMVHSDYHGTKNNVVVVHGDMIEAITVDDKRFQSDTTVEFIPLQQVEMAKRALVPIQKQIAASLQGNHEQKLWKVGDLSKFIANELNVPYGTYSCKVVYHNNGDVVLRHFAGHGFGSIRSVADDPIRVDANEQLMLKRKLKGKAGDTALMSMGHTHKLIVSRPQKTLFLTDNGVDIDQHYTSNISTGDYIHPDHRWYVNTGSFMKLYGKMGTSGYAERFGYDPIVLGFAVALVRDRELVNVYKEML